MKIFRILFAGILLLFLNSAVLSFGQQDKKDDEAKPVQQENQPADAKPAESKPDHRAQENKPSQEIPNKPENKQENKDQDKRAQEENKQQEHQQQNDETRRADQDKSKANRSDHSRAIATGQEHGAARASQRIPDDKFREHFGHEHHFKPSRPVIVENRPRIQYGGYAFEFVDAWPVGWSYDDDCYIDYIDGEYFLFDVLHPGVRIALVVVL